MSITENYRRIRESLPDNVTIVLAAKTRSREELLEALEAGVTDFGENYVQEGEAAHAALGADASRVRWHMIGSLQKNKINKALGIFDVIQTVDSLHKAIDIDKRVAAAGRDIVPVCIEINIGSEFTKAGVEPDYDIIKNLAEEIASLEHLRLEGLMTMGPRSGDPEESRPYFRKTREIFERLNNGGVPGANLTILSMGMSNSYRVAVEEGSTMVRLGTIVFGERDYG